MNLINSMSKCTRHSSAFSPMGELTLIKHIPCEEITSKTSLSVSRNFDTNTATLTAFNYQLQDITDRILHHKFFWYSEVSKIRFESVKCFLEKVVAFNISHCPRVPRIKIGSWEWRLTNPFKMFRVMQTIKRRQTLMIIADCSLVMILVGDGSAMQLETTHIHCSSNHIHLTCMNIHQC